MGPRVAVGQRVISYQDHVARLGRRRLACRHVHVGQHPPIERHDISEPRIVSLEASDDRFLAALEDADDAPFKAALRTPLDAGDDPIAVHRFRQVRCGNVDVLLFAGLRVFGDDESKSSRVGLQPADDEVHLLRKPEPVAANLQQFTVGDERRQVTLERGALFARHAQRLRQLARGRRVVDVFTNEAEDVAPGRGHAVRMICKSPTFVPVGPVRMRS